MTKPKEKKSLEKFFDTLLSDEKSLLSTYLQKETYESLSETFDELLRKPHATQKTDP